MGSPFRVSSWQLFVLVFFTSFCMTPFGFDALHTRWNRHMWVPALAQVAVTLVGSLGVISLLRRFPRQDVFSLAQQVMGPLLGRLYVFALGLYMFLWGPVGNLNTFVQLVNGTELPRTDPLLIAGFMGAVAMYGAWYGSEVVGRVGELWIWSLAPFIFLITLLSYTAGDLHRLLPLTGIPWERAAEGYFWSFALGIRGFILALAMAGMVGTSRRFHRSIVAGAMLSALTVTLMVMLPHTTFSRETLQMTRFHFPVIEALSLLDLSAVGLLSTVSLTIIGWTVIAWVVVASSLTLSAYLWARVLGIKSFRWLVVPLAVLGVWLSRLPMTTDLMEFFTNLWSGLGYGVGVAGPWLLLLVARLRGVPAGVGEDGHEPA